MNLYHRSYSARLKKYCIDILYVQCIFSLVWIPLGAYWGMGSAWLSVIGNIIFGWVVQCFLWLSSLVFFCKLCFIPCSLLISGLDALTKGWLLCMSYAPAHAMVHLTQPSLSYLAFFLMCLVVVMHSRILRKHHTISLVGLAFITTILLYKNPHQQHIIQERLALLKKDIILIEAQGVRCLIDQGALGSSANAATHIEYNFLPALYTKHGSAPINYCFILRPSLMSFVNLLVLCQMHRVCHVYVPYWQSTDQKKSKKMYKAFYALKQCIEQQGGKLHRLAQEDIEIILNSKQRLTLSNKTAKTHLGIRCASFDYQICSAAANNPYK